MAKTTTFTSESVCSGHPDKICDQISDAIVDEVLRQDPQGRVGVECMVGVDRVIMVGEVGGKAGVNYEKIARQQIERLGYIDAKFNFSHKSPIDCYIHKQSEEIAVGVKKRGAGDQGIPCHPRRRGAARGGTVFGGISPASHPVFP